MEQNVEHESASQQTKRNKDGQRHGRNCRQNPHTKKVSPDESDVTETALQKSGVIREEFIRVV